MARAKRTARAEARRRHRAERNLDQDPVDAEPTTAPSQRSTAAVDQQPARVSIGQAFRLSFRPLDLRGDLRALPWIATHSKALWVPVLITILSTGAFYITRGSDIVTQFMFAYFVQTPAIGGVFIAGFLAPRASWLLGVIVGLIAAACYSLLVLALPTPASTTGAPLAQPQDIIISAFLLSPTMGAVFASAAAWYRRFLMLSNPNRGRQGTRQGPDGRSRKVDSQKAGARR